MSEHLHMSVTKPIGTVQCDAALLASLCLSTVSVVFFVLVVILSTVPGGKAGDLKSGHNASLCRREHQVSLFWPSH